MDRSTISRRWHLGIPVGLVAVSAAVFAAAGSLDPSFGTGGVVTIVPDQFGPAIDVAVQSDGKVVVVGTEEAGAVRHWRVRRLQADGSTDTGFGTAGEVTLFGAASPASDDPRAVTLDGSGRILVVGNSHAYVTVGSGRQASTVYATLATLVRLNADGSTDATFGSAGVVRLVAPGTAPGCTGRMLVLQPDGKIVVAGELALATKKGSQNALFAARISDTGALDTSFGVGGFAVDDVTTGNDSVYPKACARQSDGKLLLGGSAGGSSSLAITRILTNGSVDASFGTLWMTNGLTRLAVDASDRILVNGGAAGNATVTRYTANGALDATFGTGGVATIHDPVAATGAGLGLAALPDGRIVLALQRVSNGGAYVARLLPTGAMDATFGSGGFGALVTVDATVAPYALSLAPGGDVVMCGYAAHTQTGGNIKNWFVARYLGN